MGEFYFMEYQVEKLSDYISEREKFETLANQIYYLTAHLSLNYPQHKKWFFEKHLPFIASGQREILFIRYHSNICGVSFLKRTKEEKKICTFYIAEHGRNIGIGRTLMQASFDFLKTNTPMITMPSERVRYFLHFIHKNDWKITQIIEGYYVRDKDEVVFNGILSKEKK